ncbi:MAG: cobalamin biosynthesis protein CobD [Bacteroidetes bacterium]|jgi:adenosylcobinamide-phosphate synthase|nr:cobalamin biosynthesis protein CobD [Bacteroidota bacterium]
MYIDSVQYIVIPLVFGFLLDLIIGDPKWLPHPIRLFGFLIAHGENQMNTGKHRFLKGALLSVSLIAATYFLLLCFLNWIRPLSILYLSVTSIGIFYGIANRSLIQESYKVHRALERNGIAAARKQLSFIVGRDTRDLNAQQIRKAILETLSENLSDGVIAPLFYYAIGGLPAMLAYKMANTLDSMTGYKNERYGQFGKFAARLDDVLNFIPARLTAMLMVILTFNYRGLFFLFRYGHKHTSPNAGYPEAALAGILNCRLGGPGNYFGHKVHKPYIGNNNKIITKNDIIKTLLINMITSIVATLIIIYLYLSI